MIINTLGPQYSEMFVWMSFQKQKFISDFYFPEIYDIETVNPAFQCFELPAKIFKT
jgi:hypothetical protein